MAPGSGAAPPSTKLCTILVRTLRSQFLVHFLSQFFLYVDVCSLHDSALHVWVSLALMNPTMLHIGVVLTCLRTPRAKSYETV
jgi:hypothetical protein